MKTVLLTCRLPEGGMPARVAYQMIKDIRQLDGNPRYRFISVWNQFLKLHMQIEVAQSASTLSFGTCRLDLASFTTTWMVSHSTLDTRLAATALKGGI